MKATKVVGSPLMNGVLSGLFLTLLFCAPAHALPPDNETAAKTVVEKLKKLAQTDVIFEPHLSIDERPQSTDKVLEPLLELQRLDQLSPLSHSLVESILSDWNILNVLLYQFPANQPIAPAFVLRRLPRFSASHWRGFSSPEASRDRVIESLERDDPLALAYAMALVPSGQQALELSDPTDSDFEGEASYQRRAMDWDRALTKTMERVLERPVRTELEGRIAERAVSFWTDFAGAYRRAGANPQILATYLLANAANPFDHSAKMIVRELRSLNSDQMQSIESLLPQLIQVQKKLPLEEKFQLFSPSILGSRPEILQDYMDYFISTEEIWTSIARNNLSGLKSFWSVFPAQSSEFNANIRKLLIQHGRVQKLIDASPSRAENFGLDSRVRRTKALTSADAAHQLSVCAERPSTCSLDEILELLTVAKELGIMTRPIADAALKFANGTTYSWAQWGFKAGKVQQTIDSANALKELLLPEFRAYILKEEGSCSSALMQNKDPFHSG